MGSYAEVPKCGWKNLAVGPAFFPPRSEHTFSLPLSPGKQNESPEFSPHDHS